MLHKRMKTVKAGSSDSEYVSYSGTHRDQLLLQVKKARYIRWKMWQFIDTWQSYLAGVTYSQV